MLFIEFIRLLAGRPAQRLTRHLTSSPSRGVSGFQRVASVPPARPPISACADKRHSEQSRARMTDEGFGVAAVRFKHFERLVPGGILLIRLAPLSTALVTNERLAFFLRPSCGGGELFAIFPA
jgi:hypothetical protein